jgi:hypothetical protein
VEQSSLYKLLQQQLATARSEVAEAEARRAALQAQKDDLARHLESKHQQAEVRGIWLCLGIHPRK